MGSQRGIEALIHSSLQPLPKNFTNKLEELRSTHPEGVDWAYELFESWKDKSNEWVADVLTSFTTILKAVQAPKKVRENLNEINQTMLDCSYMVRYEQFRDIANEVIDFHEQCHNEHLYELGIIFRKKAFLGSFPKVISGLKNLQDPPEELVGLLGQVIHSIDVSGKYVIHDKLTRQFHNLMRTIQNAVKYKIDLEPTFSHLTLSDLTKDIIRLNGQLSVEVKDAVFEYNDSTPIEDYYEEIKIIRGQETADRLKENCSLDELNHLDFLKAYTNVLLGISDQEEEKLVGQKFCQLDHNLKPTNLQAILQIKIKPTLAEKLTREAHQLGIKRNITNCFDLRPEQANLYSSQQAMLHYQRLIDKQFEPSNYQQVIQRLHQEKSLENEIIIIGGGCGPANKEIICYNELTALGYDVTMLLTDINLEAIRAALINCIRSDISLPEFRFWDLLTLNQSHFQEVQTTIEDRQVLFTLFGGTPFNLTSDQTIYANLRDILIRREGEKIRNKPDLILTEGDSQKDIRYYQQPDSQEFLKQGVLNGHQLSPEHLIHPEPIYILDNQIISAFFLTKERSPLNPALWVIDSKPLIETEFNRIINLVGFNNQFVYNNNNSVIAVSRIY